MFKTTPPQFRQYPPPLAHFWFIGFSCAFLCAAFPSFFQSRIQLCWRASTAPASAFVFQFTASSPLLFPPTASLPAQNVGKRINPMFTFQLIDTHWPRFSVWCVSEEEETLSRVCVRACLAIRTRR